MWEFLTWIVSKLTDEIGIKLTSILSVQQQILSNQEEIKRMIMGAKEQLAEFAVKVDNFTNACATSLAAIQAKIDVLNAKVAEGATPTEVGEALAEVNAHLDAVKTSLEAAAADGTVVVPPPPVEPPPVEPPPEEPL